MIDKSGRLFGKINIIDLFVIVVIIAVFAAAAYRFGPWRKGSAPETAQTHTEGEIYVTVQARLVPEEVGEQLSVGDKLVAKGAFTSAEIVSIDVAPAKWVAWTDEGQGVNTQHPIWKDVTVTIKDKGTAESPIVKCGGQEARVGLTTFVLKTQKVESPATVLDVEFR